MQEISEEDGFQTSFCFLEKFHIKLWKSNQSAA